MTAAELVVLGVCGALFGSFVNVLAHRLPRRESIVKPRSRCPACGTTIRFYDNVPIVSWLVLRGRCRDCGVQLEPVAWARPGAAHTRDFEDVVAWLAQQMAKTPIAGLLRIAWDTVGRIVERVVAEHLDERRLEGLIAIGVDEISYRRGQRYLTSVVDHHARAIVWCAPGRNAQTLQAFFDELGDRKRSIRAVSIDMSGGYEKAIRANIPDAEVCFDPFHVVRLGQRAVDQVRRDEWNAHERSHTPRGRWIKGTRWSLLKAPAKQSIGQLALLAEVQHANKALYRALLLKEELRLLYQLDESPTRPGPPRRLARLGNALATGPVRQARTHDPSPPRRHPRRHPPRPLQRPPRRPQQPHPSDQPPQLRISLRRTPHRPRLPLLRRHHHRTPAMTFTPKPTGAPEF